MAKKSAFLLLVVILSVALVFGAGCRRVVEKSRALPPEEEQAEDGTRYSPAVPPEDSTLPPEEEQTEKGTEQEKPVNEESPAEQSSGGADGTKVEGDAGSDTEMVLEEVEKEINELLDLLEQLDQISDEDLTF